MKKFLIFFSLFLLSSAAHGANIADYTDIVTMQSDDKIYVLRNFSTTPVNRDLDYSVLLTNIWTNIDTEAEFEALLFNVVTPSEDDDVPESGDLGIIDTEAEFEAELFAVVTPSELPTIPFKAKVAFEDPVATDDFSSIDYTDNNVTLTKIYCETDTGTVNLDINVDDGTPTGANGSDIACGSSGTLDSTLSGDTSYVATNKLDLAISSVSGTPGYLSVIIMGNYD